MWYFGDPSVTFDDGEFPFWKLYVLTFACKVTGKERLLVCHGLRCEQRIAHTVFDMMLVECIMFEKLSMEIFLGVVLLCLKLMSFQAIRRSRSVLHRDLTSSTLFPAT